MDTQAVLDHQMAAFANGSADEIIEDFTDDSVLISADGVVRGRAAIHEAYSEFFSDLFKPGTYDFTLDAVHVEGEVAQIVWRAICATADIPLGTDTFVIRHGKVVAQAFAAKIDPK